MLADISKSEENFSRLRDGDLDRLIEILDIERAAMFDYLMRLCGQINRSKDSLDEVGRVLQTDAAKFTSLQELRVELYKRARAANLDIWNADVRRLENSAFNNMRDDDSDEASSEALQLLDQSVGKLAGPEREVLLLRYRHGFDESEIGRIIASPSNEVVSLLKKAFQRLKSLGFAEDTDFGAMLPEIPPHPVPDRSAYSTMALSAMMSELKRSHRRPISDARWFLIAIVLGIIAVIAVLTLMGSPIFPWRR